MSRIRSVHPDACTSEKLAAISGDAERCYWRLQTHCDDDGRCEDHPRLIWAALFPLHEDVGPGDVDLWLKGLDDVGLIVRYEVGGKRYLAVTQWGRFQHPQRPKPSTIPAPDVTGIGDVCDVSATDQGHGVAGEGEGEGEGEGGRKRRPPQDFTPTEEHVAYAIQHGLQLDRERLEWITHCEANGKTYVKLNAGFSTWLSHAVQFGRGSVAAPAPRRVDEVRRCKLCANTGNYVKNGNVTPCKAHVYA